MREKWIQRLEERVAHCNRTKGTRRGHLRNIYLMDSDKEAIVAFVKDKELHDKTNEHFKYKARMECL